MSREMAHLAKCQFCSRLMDMFRRISGVSSDAEYFFRLGKLSDIVEMPCPHADSFRRLWKRGLARFEGFYEDSVKVSPQRWTVSACTLNRLMLTFGLNKQDGFDIWIDLVARPNKPGHPGTGRVLDTSWTDPSILRGWYTECLKEHGQNCDQPTWMRLRPERIAMPEWLVDVVDNCIVPCPSDTARYITLSYTWGGFQCLRHTSITLERLKNRGSLHPELAPDIPETVRNAFEITKLLGERYLWVDSLCIDQEDTAASKNLNSMHHIYANSVICLIAHAGRDANHGLRGIRGVSAPRDIEQLELDMAEGETLSWITDYDDRVLRKAPEVEGSTYNKRGWTYQEYLFSKRRLIFTDGLLRWICECATRGEEFYGDLGGLGPEVVSGVPTWWLTNPCPDLRLVASAANPFNTRYFTYESDTLRAFLGIQNHISRNFLGGLNYGHPEMFFDISLLWERLRTTLKSARWVSANSDPPSWSWMGWQGEFYFPTDHEFLPKRTSIGTGFTQSVAQWYTMHTPLARVSEMRPVKCRWQICRTAVEIGSTHIPVGWEQVAISQEGSEHYYRRVSSYQDVDSHLNLTYLPLCDRWDTYEFRYPVPLPPSTAATRPFEQRPFIFARTTRCFLTAKKLMSSNLRPGPSRAHYEREELGLFHHGGECVGLLRFDFILDALCFPVELVAVVKGWSTAFSDCFLTFGGREEPVGTQRATKIENKIKGRPLMRHDCYFLLCVKWENGVAKRQGTGMVEADIWERNHEPVDLILG